MKQRIFTVLTILAITAFALLASCVRDNVDEGRRKSTVKGERAVISFSPLATELPAAATRAGYHGDPDDPELAPGEGAGGSPATGAEKDSEINHLRILMYDSGSGALVENLEFDMTTEEFPVTAEVLSGEYDFFFIVNGSYNDSNGYDPDMYFYSSAADFQESENYNLALRDNSKINTIAKLENLKISQNSLAGHTNQPSSFDSHDPDPNTLGNNLPMFEAVRGVAVNGGDNNIVLPSASGGEVTGGVWHQPVTRASVRLSIELTLTPEQFGDWGNGTPSSRLLNIENTPFWTYMMPGKFNDGASATSSIGPGNTYPSHNMSLSARASETAGEKIGQIQYLDKDGLPVSALDMEGSVRVRYDRILLPELMLEDKDDKSKAMWLVLHINDSNKAATINANPADGLGYNLPRGTWLHLDASVKENELVVVPRVLNWNEAVLEDVLFADGYTLRADRSFMSYLQAGGDQQINIFTDAPGGWTIEPIEAPLSGWFETDINVGPADATTEVIGTALAPNPGPGARTPGYFLITAYGGRLRKVVTVGQMGNADSAPPDGFTPYVGAFWKHDQTGERLIRTPRLSWGNPSTAIDGRWTAAVVEGAEWIRLDKMMTSDPNVGWLPGANEASVRNGNDTGFDQKYPVKGGVSAVEGTVSPDTPDGIFFRIGLDGQIGADQTRYGVVLLTYTAGASTNYQRIWIRQGEEPDYLMYPDDASGNGVLGSRPFTMKFSPYNLTAAEFMGSGIDRNSALDRVDVRPGGAPSTAVFTDYPSQAGAYFMHSSAGTAEVYAFSPLANLKTPPSPIPITSLISLITPWFADDNEPEHPTGATADNHETCPPGYRRPSEGNDEVYIPNPSIGQSEILQSLFYSPVDTKEDNGGVDNSTYGFYADGFFDRRSADSSPKAEYSDYYYFANPNRSNVAIMGRLLYNPEHNNSIFFPFTGTGMSYDGQGFISYGVQGAYSSSSIPNWTTSWRISFSRGLPGNDDGRRSVTVELLLPIRCVKDEYPVIPTEHYVDAPPGVLGVRESDGELTLLGSSFYDGNTSNGGDAAVKGTAGERVWMAYFKPGSLIGLYGGQEGDLFDASDVAWAPTPAMLAAVKAEIGSKTGEQAWAVIDEWNAATLPANTAENIAAGFGDPCSLADDNNSLGTEWALPTVGEDSSGDWTWNGKKYDGNTVDYVTVNGVEGVADKADHSMFLPYAGNRFYGEFYVESGVINLVELYDSEPGVFISVVVDGGTIMAPFGKYQSSAWLYNATYSEYGYYQDGLGVAPGSISTGGMATISQHDAAPIRCVPAPEPEPDGAKAVHGVIGYIWNPGGEHHLELTLDGDKDYIDGGPGEFQSIQDEYRVYVAYFKFGSLVATDGRLVDNDGSPLPFTSDNVVAWPWEWASTADRSEMEAKFAGASAGTAAWSRIPVITDKHTTLSYGKQFPSIEFPADRDMALDDPCDYYFNGGWKTPTTAENNAFAGNPNKSQIAPDELVNGLVYYEIENAGMTSMIGIFPQSPGGSVALPATGNRYDGDGYPSHRGNGGFYWSSTARNGTLGDGFYYSSYYLMTASNTTFARGQAVRCVNCDPIPAANVTISRNPSGELEEGTTVTFTANVTGSVTAMGAVYQWQSSTDGGSTWTDIAGANHHTYTTTVTETQNRFRVSVTKCGQTSVVVGITISDWIEHEVGVGL